MALWAREVSGAFEKRTPGHSGIGGILAMKTQFALAGKLCKWEYKRTFVFHPIILLEATIAEIGDPTRPTSKSGLTQQSTSTFAWSWACPSPGPLCSKDGERYSDCRRRTGTQIAVKTKTFLILTSNNETIITPKTQRNSDSEPLREMKIAFKNRTVREITAFDWREWNDFWFELSGGSKKWVRRNQDSTVVILRHRILLAYLWLQSTAW